MQSLFPIVMIVTVVVFLVALAFALSRKPKRYQLGASNVSAFTEENGSVGDVPTTWLNMSAASYMGTPIDGTAHGAHHGGCDAGSTSHSSVDCGAGGHH